VSPFKYRLSRRTLETIYKSFILPIFDYCGFIWDNCNKEHVKLLENLNLDALRTICGATRGTSHNSLYLETGLGPLVDRRHMHKLSVFYTMKNTVVPSYLSDLVPNTNNLNSRYNLRNADALQEIKCNTKLYCNSFLPDSVHLWNSLSEDVQNTPTLGSFKRI
jgi:hypothetical protein